MKNIEGDTKEKFTDIIRIETIIVFSIVTSLIIGGSLAFGIIENIILPVSISLFFINAYFSFKKINSNLISVMYLIVLFIFMTNTGNKNGLNGDYKAYEGLYMHFSNGGSIGNIAGYTTDYFYMALMKLISLTGIEYNGFLILVSLTSFFLIFSTIKELTKNYNLILLCYSISPFFYDVFQIRYFFAYSIVIFALKYIITKKNNGFKYTLLILFASLFHKAILFFLIYNLVFFRIKLILQLVFSVFSGVTILSLFTKINLIDFFYSKLNISSFETYTSNEIKYEISSTTSLLTIFFIIVLIWIINLINSQTNEFIVNRVLWLNYFNILLMPFMFITLDFERYTRPIMLINYALIASYLHIFKLRKKIIIIIFLLLVLLTRQIIMIETTKTVIENNLFINYDLFDN
ncbi:EpsG family protein [Exiguobacterium sp. 9-2]|uniref:EpsG family protein n=1 Tax=Exiguobacterium sp. 9-2 TaxID=3112419 RepID=UPI002E338F5B|nr:EpsG family protein [Exiguobacterium sp. 9-2]